MRPLHTISPRDPSDDYVYGPSGTPIEQVSQSSGAATYLYTDQLGSVVMEADSSGNVIGTQSYNPYGTLASSTGTDPTPFGFQDGYTDPSGLVYFINRYYDPATRQFVGGDPLVGLTGAAYSYVGGDPVNGMDPLGLFSLNPIQWLLDALNNISTSLSTAAQQLSQEASSLNNQIAQLKAELVGASDPQTICNEIAADKNQIRAIQSGFHELSNIGNILSGIYGDVATISGVGAILACVIGAAATIVGFITGAGEELAGAVADLLSDLIGSAVSSNFIEANTLLSEVGSDVHDCATAF